MDCRICLENIENDELWLNLKCNHSFHYQCLSKMKSSLCPLCREDNNDFLRDKGIHIEGSDDDDYSDDGSTNTYDSFESYERYEERYVYDRNIDELVDGKNFSNDFVIIIKSLELYFNDDMINRAKTLYDELQRYGLKINYNSEKCKNFIIGNRNAEPLQRVVDIARETDWFFRYTDYPIKMHHDEDIDDRYERSLFVKDDIIHEYVKDSTKFRVRPPDTIEIRKIIDRYTIYEHDLKEIEKWNGDININVFDLIKGYASRYEKMINCHLRKYVDLYTNNNYDKYLCDDINQTIIKLFGDKLRIYSCLQNLVYEAVTKKITEEINSYCKDLDYRYNEDWYNNHNSFCCQIIDEYVKSEIGKKYTKEYVGKFFFYEREDWNKHLKGSKKFKSYVCQHIENSFNLDVYIKQNNLFYKEDLNGLKISKFCKSKLSDLLDNYLIKNMNYCIPKLATSNYEKLKSMTMQEKSNFFVRKEKYNDRTLMDLNISIISWFLINHPKDIENDDHRDYLKKVLLVNNYEIVRKLKSNSYFRSALPNMVCSHTSSPHCTNHACKNCCNNGCTYHGNAN